MMSGIKGKDTKPEMTVRRILHAAGFRYRLHDKKLSGKPDIVLPRYGAVIFVHGCFWHGHNHCSLFRMPSSRQEFWSEKIGGNIQRDAIHTDALLQTGWKVGTVWECAIKGKGRLELPVIAERLRVFICNPDIPYLEIRGLQ